jgi:hypothetical protein
MIKISTKQPVLFSCSTLSDLETFKLALPRIRKYIRPEKLTLSVPDSDFGKFKLEFADKVWIELKKDSDYFSLVEYERLNNLLTLRGKESKVNWYLQQLIKIEMLRTLEPDQLGVIWDSDTIPLRPIQFLSHQNKLKLFVSDEYHEPYFVTNERILGVSKQIEFSFIAQCLPIYGYMVADIITKLDGDSDWWVNIINNLTDEHVLAFSEYEFLGSYIWENYSGITELNHSSWERNGFEQSIFFRDLEKFLDKMSLQYTFVAIEKIERRYIVKRIVKKLKAILKATW